MKVVAILPAAGKASRMNGLPKFALPINNFNQTLIERHITQIQDFVNQIVIPTTPSNLNLIENMNIGMKSTVFSLETNTMSQTIFEVIREFPADRYVLFMPDTYFHGEAPHKHLAHSQSPIELAIFSIRNTQKGKLGQVKIDKKNNVLEIVDKSENCNYKYAWGALTFDKTLIEFIKPEDAHIGYAVAKSLGFHDVKTRVFECEYFDCGTPNEYFDLIKCIT